MSYRLASDLKTHLTVWIDKNGNELNPIVVCAYYRKKYASDVKKTPF